MKFHDVIKNIVGQCIYQKVSGSEVYFLVLCVDDVLLATNDKALLQEMKQFLSKNFDMKGTGEASYKLALRSIRISLKAFWIYLKKPISIRS